MRIDASQENREQRLVSGSTGFVWHSCATQSIGLCSPNFIRIAASLFSGNECSLLQEISELHFSLTCLSVVVETSPELETLSVFRCSRPKDSGSSLL
jgi:hypothetical protein